MQRSRLVALVVAGLSVSHWSPSQGGGRPKEAGAVTLRILGSAHDNGEIKPCG